MNIPILTTSSSEPFYVYLLPLISLFLVLVIRVGLPILMILALLKYLHEKKEEKKDSEIKRSLGEVLKDHRMRCQMTQEFVAETMGVTRQAVSKWENGTSDPSTSNLLKLAKLYGVSPEELIRSIRIE